jgi:hypothetical protein
MSDEYSTPSTAPNWRGRLWDGIHAYVAACGGTVDLRADPSRAAVKIDAVRRVDAALADAPGLDAQLRADVRAYRADAATARLVAAQLVEIAEACMVDDLDPLARARAREALARVAELLGRPSDPPAARTEGPGGHPARRD